MIILRQRLYSSEEEDRARRKKIITGTAAALGTAALATGAGILLHKRNKSIKAANDAKINAIKEESEKILRDAKEYAEKKGEQTAKDVAGMKEVEEELNKLYRKEITKEELESFLKARGINVNL